MISTPPKFTSLFLGLLAIINLCWCIYRDMQIEKQYPGDLRNRIVGSRLQHDGASPYFYHWKAADKVRYYDWDNYGTTLKISNVTATPFFHLLLYPLSNLPQRAISRLWLVLEYTAMLVMTLLALQLARDRRQQVAVLVVSLLFLHSYAWLTHVGMGQLYIFIPLLSMLFYYFISKEPAWWNAVFAGVFAVSLVLIRPNAVLFLLPFLLLLKRYGVKYKLTFLASGLAVLLFAFGNSQLRSYWSDYMVAMNEQVKMHQDLSPTLQNSQPVPVLEQYEGWDRKQIDEAQHFPYYKGFKEHGNVFVLLNMSLHVKTPVWVLSAMCITFLLLICLFYQRIYGNTAYLHKYSLGLLGVFLYMASDLFSPVHRFSYNGVQWIFPLLVAAGTYTVSFNKILVAGVLTGMVLNSLPLYLIPLRHSVGEYIIYASLLGLLYTNQRLTNRRGKTFLPCIFQPQTKG